MSLEGSLWVGKLLTVCHFTGQEAEHVPSPNTPTELVILLSRRSISVNHHWALGAGLLKKAGILSLGET